eukprot:4588839-Pleurochrysis_carterae.AAC.1
MGTGGMVHREGWCTERDVTSGESANKGQRIQMGAKRSWWRLLAPCHQIHTCTCARCPLSTASFVRCARRMFSSGVRVGRFRQVCVWDVETGDMVFNFAELHSAKARFCRSGCN